MKHYLIVDPACPIAYDSDSLSKPGLGGTEATVIRLAKGLVGVGAQVTVMQHCRASSCVMEGISWTPPVLPRSTPDVVLILRDPSTALELKRQYVSKKVYLWLHDLATPRLVPYLERLHANGVEIVCVSEYHKQQILDTVHSNAPDLVHMPKVHVIYNPIAQDLAPDATKVNPNKLVFFSSPHKGLEQTLTLFSSLKHQHPALELHIANPGYFHKDFPASPGVHFLGDLSHEEVLQHVREASFVFYPNSVFPETFGLVFAEANAVGTPVLTHAIGAAREVLSDASQLVDCRDIGRVSEKVNLWLRGSRPSVVGKGCFRITEVVRAWQNLK